MLEVNSDDNTQANKNMSPLRPIRHPLTLAYRTIESLNDAEMLCQLVGWGTPHYFRLLLRLPRYTVPPKSRIRFDKTAFL
jgi:hypothetical protein